MHPSGLGRPFRLGVGAPKRASPPTERCHRSSRNGDHSGEAECLVEVRSLRRKKALLRRPGPGCCSGRGKPIGCFRDREWVTHCNRQATGDERGHELRTKSSARAEAALFRPSTWMGLLVTISPAVTRPKWLQRHADQVEAANGRMNLGGPCPVPHKVRKAGPECSPNSSPWTLWARSLQIAVWCPLGAAGERHAACPQSTPPGHSTASVLAPPGLPPSACLVHRINEECQTCVRYCTRMGA